MACDIRKIVDKLHAVIDTSVKGSAMAITQKDDGNFSVIWGDSFRIKTRAQAVHAAEQKVDTAHKKADEAGFNHKIFGPYLAIDTSPENEIVIKKLPTTKLERALEIRNEASEKEKAISEIMSEQDREFFDAQRADNELLNQQNDNKLTEDLSSRINIKPNTEKLFDSNPELANAVYEALGFVSKMITREGQEYFNNPRIRFFVKIADEVRASLPKVKEGYTRLYRGNRPSDLKSNPQFTNSLEGIALPFLMSYEGQLSYIDIPTSDLSKYVQKGDVATNAEFIVTPEIAKTATPINNSIIEKYKQQYPDKFAPIEITPQQKQQAQQLYSQYLEQNPNGSVEQFKSWVDEFNKNKYLQLASNLTNPAIEELDNFLLDFLKQFNVKTKEFEELKSKLGVDALGATDVLNKLIWYVKNRNEETLPEEAAHMLVALMGENHPDIKELLNNIINWSEYNYIRKEYLPIYKDENKVKIEALGKLIAKSLIKNYKVNGLDKNLLQKALDKILNFIENILNSINLSNIFFYNQSIADHIAINVLSGNKDYIYKIKNLNSDLNALEEIENNPNAKKIINIFSSSNVKMTGSLAIAGTENIRRPKGQGIHDIDFKVKSFEVFNKEVEQKIPENAVPAHYGWHKKAYSTFAYLIPKEGYYIKVLERKDGFSNGWITNYELYDKSNNKVEITQDNVTAVDFFVYKEGSNQKDFDFSSDFIPATLVYEGKMSLGGKSNPYFFSRDKDQEDYVLRNPKSFIPFEKHIYYQLASNKELEERVASEKTIRDLAERISDRIGIPSKLDIESLKKGIKNDVYKNMFEKNPTEFLKFVAEQFYGISNGAFSNIEAATDETISDFGQDLVDAALNANPLDSLLKPDGLPPIEPSC